MAKNSIEHTLLCHSNLKDISDCLVEFGLRNEQFRLSSRPSIVPSKSQHNLRHHAKRLAKFYEDDEVVRISPEGKIQFGLVSYNESEEKDAKGKSNVNLVIFWTIGQRLEIEELDLNANSYSFDNIKLIDRKVNKGDYVRIYDGETVKEGEVVQVKFVASVKCMENKDAIVDIPCENLDPVLIYHIGQKLVMHDWLGVITSVETIASLMLSNGKTFNINLKKLPPKSHAKSKFYPGANISLTLCEYLAAGADDNVEPEDSLKRLFFGDEEIPAFVVFMRIESVEIDWKFKLPLEDEVNVHHRPPSKTVKRSRLKRHARILPILPEFIWSADSTSNSNNGLLPNHIYDTYYRYTVQNDDLILPDCAVEMEKLLRENLFPHHPSVSGSSAMKIDALKSQVHNVSYVVQILRTARVILIKWNDTDQIEAIRSASVDEKFHFEEPYHQIVQRKLHLQKRLEDTVFGVTLARRPNDQVEVQWLEKIPEIELEDLENNDNMQLIKVLERTQESMLDLEPHYFYGEITCGEIVCRNSMCKLPPALFTYGVVQKITAAGSAIVQNPLTKKEYPLFPFEIRVAVAPKSRKVKLLEAHESNLSISSNAISTPIHCDIQGLGSNLFANSNLSKMMPPPDQKFQLYAMAPENHHFYNKRFEYNDEYLKVVSLDRAVLHNIFSDGIWVRGFKDRWDLYMAMIAGPKDTPYEDGLFQFDIQLPSSYTRNPPQIYMTTRLSPSTYSRRSYKQLEPGIIDFKEFATNPPVTILEALIDIQNHYFHGHIFRPLLIDVKNYRLSATKDSKTSITNYNGFTIINVIDLLFRLLAKPPPIWREGIIRYINLKLPKISLRLKKFLYENSQYSEGSKHDNPLAYHLFPLSEGVIQAVQNRINKLDDFMSQTAMLQQLV